MRWILSFLLIGLLAVVQAASSSGNKLLVVLEELAEKSKYSKYLADLEGMGSWRGDGNWGLQMLTMLCPQGGDIRSPLNRQRMRKLRCLSSARELMTTFYYSPPSRKVYSSAVAY